MAVTEKKILFLCSENTVRSPMAEALLKQALGSEASVYSAGVDSTQINPFAIAVMQEKGINLMDHESRSFEKLGERDFDLIVALSQPAWELARDIAKDHPATVEYWDTPAPPELGASANRDQIIESYRRIRDDIARHITNRFNLPTA
jgi:protein-tyrosine-phosphatase